MYSEVEHTLENAYTVGQIMQELKGLDPDARVVFVCSYGDYHNTQQALPVNEIMPDLSTDDLAETAYSESGIQLVEDRELGDEPCEENDVETIPVVVLRS